MKARNKPLGNNNLIGANVEKIRKQKDIKQKELLADLHLKGLDMSASSLSKIEGQFRAVTDIELVLLANALDVHVSELLDM